MRLFKTSLGLALMSSAIASTTALVVTNAMADQESFFVGKSYQAGLYPEEDSPIVDGKFTDKKFGTVRFREVPSEKGPKLVADLLNFYSYGKIDAGVPARYRPFIKSTKNAIGLLKIDLNDVSGNKCTYIVHRKKIDGVFKIYLRADQQKNLSLTYQRCPNDMALLGPSDPIPEVNFNGTWDPEINCLTCKVSFKQNEQGILANFEHWAKPLQAEKIYPKDMPTTYDKVTGIVSIKAGEPFWHDLTNRMKDHVCQYRAMDANTLMHQSANDDLTDCPSNLHRKP